LGFRRECKLQSVYHSISAVTPDMVENGGSVVVNMNSRRPISILRG